MFVNAELSANLDPLKFYRPVDIVEFFRAAPIRGLPGPGNTILLHGGNILQ